LAVAEFEPEASHDVFSLGTNAPEHLLLAYNLLDRLIIIAVSFSFMFFYPLSQLMIVLLELIQELVSHRTQFLELGHLVLKFSD
jgi:hypothetical protein